MCVCENLGQKVIFYGLFPVVAKTVIPESQRGLAISTNRDNQL
jgi:hypothetical protein